MKNANVLKAQREGFQFTGSTSRGTYDRASLLPRLDDLKRELKPYGGTAKILLVVETSQFRNRVDKHSYWAIYAKYPQSYLDAKKRENENRKWESRMNELAEFVKKLSENELAFIKELVKS